MKADAIVCIKVAKDWRNVWL